MLELFTLGSGSGGNSTLVRTARTALLIDAGLSARQIALRLQAGGHDPAALDAIIVTHEHRDHIGGVGVFTRRYPIPVTANEATRSAAAPVLDGVGIETFRTGETFAVGDLEICTFPVPHDAAEPVGLTITAEGLRIGYATDLGWMPEPILDQLRGCDLVVLESNHDRDLLLTGPYPRHVKERIDSDRGHLENAVAADAAAHLAAHGTRHLVLAHLSETNNTPGRVRRAVSDALQAAGAGTVTLATASQRTPLERITL